jgi:hypothetical protein
MLADRRGIRLLYVNSRHSWCLHLQQEHCLRDTSSDHSAQSTGVFTAFDVHYTEGRGVGIGGLLPSSDHGADLVSSCLRHYSSCSRGYYSSWHIDCRTFSTFGFLVTSLGHPRRRHRQRRLRLLSATFEGCLYFVVGSFLSTSALDSFLVLVAKGGDR